MNIHTGYEATVSDICEMFGLTPRAVRYYEAKGLITVERSRLNHRIYSLRARDRLGLISALRRAGVSLRDIRDLLDEREAAGGAQAGRAVRLLRERLRSLDVQRRGVEAALQRFERPAEALARAPA